MLVVDQGKQQMLERRVFVMARGSRAQRVMESLLKLAGEGRHLQNS
jgi:hypothetical protein